MQTGYGLHLEQSQKLIMTPELRQAITVLQLSSLELTAYIEHQLQENPMLELHEDETERGSEPAEKEEFDKSGEEKKEYDLDWEEYFQDSSDLGVVYREQRAERPDFTYENFLSQAPTLTEHLMSQLYLSQCCLQDRLIGEYLIGNIDENGYLQVSLPEAASRMKLNLCEAARALNMIHGFDPPGVGARNLEECLLIQIQQLGIRNGITKKLVEHYLEDLAKGKIGRIAQDIGVAVQDVQEAADILRTLDPKPGRNFSGPNDTRYIIPDVVLEKVEGEYVVLVNDVAIPRIAINAAYRSALAKDKYCDLKTRRFVESKLNAAAWLLRSIEQRRLTLYKVAKCLVELQRDFLDHGIKYLRPLNLRVVAEKVDLHESTVSRATSNKYIQTPQGVLEMKFFFPTGLSNVTGNTTSTEYIKIMLREIVAGEESTAPFSDQSITDMFKRKGITISRRTVAKYRSELGIPAAGKRKRY